jgi:tetratricopeptide (TPR) repeat protein/predicted Ser/Thr protein kinase
VSEALSDRAAKKLLAMAAEGEREAAAQPAPPRPPGDRYEIIREIGRGGMGVVYEAHDRQLGRRCALKMIHPLFGDGEELRRRLAREALAAARLRHPHIAAVYDATPDWISMQLIAGFPIGAIHKSERRTLVTLVRDAARAVHHAHEQGIVHRDLKPSNLLVEGRHVFVVDFGLAKEIALDDSRTLSGMVLGTPAFMSPEQALGRNSAIDARTDVYALGATLTACLTGAPPFSGGEIVALLRRVAEEPPRPPAIERDLDLVVLKCLEKDPGQRYPSAAELADDLDRWLRNEPVHARRPSLGYRISKLLQRRKAIVKGALAAALAAAVVTALILAPILFRESTAREAAAAARDAAREAVELTDRATVRMQDAAAFARLGDHPSARQMLDAAIATTREFLTRHEIARVRYLLSRLHRARGQNEIALAELDRAIAADPSLTEARFERGLMAAARPSLGDAERAAAIADLRSALGGDPALTNVDRLYGRGEVARLEGRLAEASELLREVLAYDAVHVGARTSLSWVALAAGDDDLARHYSVSAVDLLQGFGPIYLARERRLLPTNILGLETVLVDFAPALADGPDNGLALAHRGLVQLRRALRLARENRRDDAIAAVQAAISDHDAALVIHAHVAGALNNRAACLMEAERLFAAAGDSAAAAEARSRAEADLARAIVEAPRLPEAHLNLAISSLRGATLLRILGNAPGAQRRLEAARESLERALAVAPPGWPHERLCRAKLAETQAPATR